MKTLKIANGDIAVLGDGNTVKLTGPDRIKQDLALWILEPLRTDVMYPGFGSKMGSLIGSPATYDSISQIRSEVVRIVDNYIAYQKRQIEIYKGSSAQDSLDAWKAADVIGSVDVIRVTAVADTCRVEVQLTTVGGETVSLSEVL